MTDQSRSMTALSPEIPPLRVHRSWVQALPPFDPHAPIGRTVAPVWEPRDQLEMRVGDEWVPVPVHTDPYPEVQATGFRLQPLA